jgi:ribose transport system ATP-binding protein
MPTAFLQLSGVTKSFGKTRALSDVDFDLLAGEVHALVGENGAGKSTLLGILSGVISPDQGRIEIEGDPVVIDGTARAQALGIGTVFQELSLAGSLSVAENIFAGRLPTVMGFVRWSQLRHSASDILSEFDIRIDVERPVDSLPLGTRQLVEIGKALSLNSRILLLDEPTSALTVDEVDALFRVLRRLRMRGIGIVYVSHKMAEVFRIADRITVLRDGRRVSTRPVGETSPASVVRDMVGRHLTALTDAKNVPGQPALAARRLSRRGEFTGVDLAIRFGEVVALAGILGAYRTQLMCTLAGILRPHAGTIELCGEPVRFRDLRDAMRRGIAYVPDDRRTEGLFLTRSVTENAVVTTLRRFTHMGLVDAGASRAAARQMVDRFHIKTPGLGAPAGKLSGGNQQKLMLSKWLQIDPAILLVNEPTKGVDVEAKTEIHQQIRQLAAAGKAVLVLSSDLPELLAVSDRIVVMREGHVVAALESCVATEEEVLRIASGAERPIPGEAA